MSKPSRFVLPKQYIRKSNNCDVEEELRVDAPVVLIPQSKQVQPPQPEENKKSKKCPSAYHIFMKETMAELSQTHKSLTSRERFSLTVLLWNEHKKTQEQTKRG